MRINKYVALATGMSRRAADTAINEHRIDVNGATATTGYDVQPADTVLLDGKPITATADLVTIRLHKPVGYVCSRNGQGSQTIYDLLPLEYHRLKPIGRLDKASSGLLLLTNDGQLAQQLTHPSHHKTKVYEITLDQPLQPLHRQMINDHGVLLEDGASKLALARQHDNDETRWIVTMHEGRNRQIRRTFASLGYTVTRLHRTHFGSYTLGNLAAGDYQSV